MNISEELKTHIDANSCFPSVAEVKRLRRSDQWETLGKIFKFVPSYLQANNGKLIIDWRSVPQSLYSYLSITNPWKGGKQPKSFPPAYHIDPRSPLGVKNTVKTGVNYKRTTKQKTFERQDGKCYWCEKETDSKDWTIDHVQPLARGGGNIASNKVGSCRTCNHAKSCLTAEEFMGTDYYLILRGKTGGKKVKEAVKDAIALLRRQ